MQFPKERYHGLHIHNLLSVGDGEKLSCVDIFVSKRIGSDSQFGTIWLCSLNNFSFVIKVQTNFGKAHREFKVQDLLSHTYSNF